MSFSLILEDWLNRAFSSFRSIALNLLTRTMLIRYLNHLRVFIGFSCFSGDSYLSLLELSVMSHRLFLSQAPTLGQRNLRIWFRITSIRLTLQDDLLIPNEFRQVHSTWWFLISNKLSKFLNFILFVARSRLSMLFLELWASLLSLLALAHCLGLEWLWVNNFFLDFLWFVIITVVNSDTDLLLLRISRITLMSYCCGMNLGILLGQWDNVLHVYSWLMSNKSQRVEIIIVNLNA